MVYSCKSNQNLAMDNLFTACLCCAVFILVGAVIAGCVLDDLSILKIGGRADKKQGSAFAHFEQFSPVLIGSNRANYMIDAVDDQVITGRQDLVHGLIRKILLLDARAAPGQDGADLVADGFLISEA